MGHRNVSPYRAGIKDGAGFPAGFHLLGGELKDFGGGGGSSLGPLGVKNKVSKKIWGGGSN